VIGHQLAAIEGDHRHVAVCECGWRSHPSLALATARNRWHVHHHSVHASAIYRRAEQRAADAERRGAEALARYEMARARYERLRDRAASVPLQTAAPASLPGGAERGQHAPDGHLLDAARVFAGFSVFDLWHKYVAVGGDAGPDELDRWLHDDEISSDYDHDLIALALNEHFAAAGFGHPVEYWR
jgi:hypothetical protein